MFSPSRPSTKVGGFLFYQNTHSAGEEYCLAIVLQILAPGKHCDVVWQQRITLVTFLYKLVTLPNNIVDPITGITSVNFFNKVLTIQFV